MRHKSLKVSIKTKKNGEVFTDYCMAAQPAVFRYHLLKSIINDMATDMTVMIDTSRRRETKTDLLDEAYLSQMHLRYAVLPVYANPGQFFGISLNLIRQKAEMKEKRMIFELTGDAFSKPLFDKLTDCDIAIGFGREKSFEELCAHWMTEGEGILFDRSFFKDSIYDSVIYTRLRSTFSTENYLEAIADEMGL